MVRILHPLQKFSGLLHDRHVGPHIGVEYVIEAKLFQSGDETSL